MNITGITLTKLPERALITIIVLIGQTSSTLTGFLEQPLLPYTA